MKEDLLHYIWQFQYFNNADSRTISGESLKIFYPGSHNRNQGPDFKEAKIRIGKTTWAGNIELHVRSSDWNLHNHSADVNFNNIILHVVWHHDVGIKDQNNIDLPTFELKSRVSKLLLEKYRALMAASHFIPCENNVLPVNELIILSWKQRLVSERLIAKSAKILSILRETNFHWEETFWRLIAANFGLKVNSESFAQIAKNLPVSILAKHKNRIHQVEALLFGTAGLLNADFSEKYPQMLQKEFLFYKKKYGLKTLSLRLSFLRMRPANFPTIRLAQLSMLIHESEHLFSKIKNAASVSEVKKMLGVTSNDYWHYHYNFEELSPYKEKRLGMQMINNVLINTVIPVLFSYGLQKDDEFFKDKAVKWLGEISAEKNVITRGFEKIGFINKNAWDSQALLHLKKEYCDQKLCLHCAIGNALLKRSQGI